MSRIESPDTLLVELLRRSDAPSDEDVRRVRAAIGVKLAVGVGASTALLAGSHASSASRLSFLGAWGKGLLLVSSLVGVGIGLTWYAKSGSNVGQVERGLRAPASSTMSENMIAVDAQSGRSEVESRVVESRQPESQQKVRSAPLKTPNRASPSTLEAELALLGRAQRALTSGQPSEALRTLDEHARRFPSGVLAAERSGVRTVALCQAGRLDEGRTAARSYLRIVPNSVLSRRIRIACQLPVE